MYLVGVKNKILCSQMIKTVFNNLSSKLFNTFKLKSAVKYNYYKPSKGWSGLTLLMVETFGNQTTFIHCYNKCLMLSLVSTTMKSNYNVGLLVLVSCWLIFFIICLYFFFTITKQKRWI